MFVKIYLLVLCAVLLNASESNSDCHDLLTCVGALIAGSIHTNNVTAKPINRTSVLNSMNNILIQVSDLIVDAFKNITKEMYFSKDVLNDTVIGVQTFKINDTVNFNETSEKVKVVLRDTLENDKSSSSTNDYILFLKDIMGLGNDKYLSPVETGADWKISTAEFTDIFTTLPVTNINKTSIYNETEYPATKESTNKEIIPKIDLDEYGEKSGIVASTYRIVKEEKAFSNIKVTNISLNVPKTMPSNDTISDQPMNVDILKHLNLSLLEQQEISKESIVLNNRNKFNDTVDKNGIVSHNISQPKIENKEESTLEGTTLHRTSKDNHNNLESNKTSVINKLKNYYDHDVKKLIILNYSIQEQNQTIPITKTISDDFSYFDNQNMHDNDLSFDDDFGSKIEEENVTDYLELDYISLFNDTTVEDVKYIPPTYVPSTKAPVKAAQIPTYDGIESIFPWIATLFIKDGETGQFQYICDGSLVSERVVLTTARCVRNVTKDVRNILVILGKTSLQEIRRDEKVVRVKHIKLHEAFTANGGMVENDLAIIVLNEAIPISNDTHPVQITDDDIEYNDDDKDDNDDLEVKEKELLATTGWHVAGPITPIYFDDVFKCGSSNSNTFCAVIGDGVNTCPSFGGIFVSRNDKKWSLHGIMTGAPTSSGVCFNKKVTFINVSHYSPWIKANIDNINKQSHK